MGKKAKQQHLEGGLYQAGSLLEVSPDSAPTKAELHVLKEKQER